MYGDGFCNFNVVSWYDTLFAILEPPDFPPLITGRIVDNQDLIAKTDGNLVIALCHEVE